MLVASTPEIFSKNQGDLWDCGKLAGDQSIQVEHAGKPASRSRRGWNATGRCAFGKKMGNRKLETGKRGSHCMERAGAVDDWTAESG
jgi:hypothetical protein